MRLVTFRHPGGLDIRPGALDGEEVVDLSAAGSGAAGPASILELLRGGPDALAAARSAVERTRPSGRDRLPLSQVQLLAPLPRPNSIRDFMLVEEHVQNSFGSVPPEWYTMPIHWKGNPDTVYGPDDEIPWPYYTGKLDFELEVAAVLGRPAHRVSVQEAQDCIVGFTIFNDWSARDIQLREMSVGLGPGLRQGLRHVHGTGAGDRGRVRRDDRTDERAGQRRDLDVGVARHDAVHLRRGHLCAVG